MLELVEEALDQVAMTVEQAAESRDVDAVRHRLDVRPGTPMGHGRTQGVAVVDSVDEQDLAFADGVQHVGRAAAVMRLPFGQLEHDGMDFGGQATRGRPMHRVGARLAAADGGGPPF